MSDSSDVDRSQGVDRLVRYLEKTDWSMTRMKAYVAAAAAREVPGGVVLDVGCGLGLDLARLVAAGTRPVGLDASGEMLGRARSRVVDIPLVRGDAGALPFRGASIDGCRVERVLQHLVDPAAAISELARVVRPGGFLAVLEPDNRTFHVESTVATDGSIPARLLVVRHPAIGGDIAGLLERAGFRVDDVVTESSRGYRLDRLPIDAEGVVTRAVADGRVDEDVATAWLAEQRARSDEKPFRARWDKVLVVARRA